MSKYVYFFGGKTADGDGSMKDLLGGKGANLAEMCRIGLPVPAGFTITTECCTAYFQNHRTYPAELKQQVAEALKKVEAEMGLRFGDPEAPRPWSAGSAARRRSPARWGPVPTSGLAAKPPPG